jgi:hypothetical protein
MEIIHKVVSNRRSALAHTVLARNGEFLVVYPTPGIDNIPTLALICRTEQQAIAEAARLNGGVQ